MADGIFGTVYKGRTSLIRAVPADAGSQAGDPESPGDGFFAFDVAGSGKGETAGLDGGPA